MASKRLLLQLRPEFAWQQLYPDPHRLQPCYQIHRSNHQIGKRFEMGDFTCPKRSKRLRTYPLTHSPIHSQNTKSIRIEREPVRMAGGQITRSPDGFVL